jgi:alpha,alpha-trehalase
MSEWTLSYEGFDPADEKLREALCTVGNGFFATRGAAPEMHASDVHYPGTYVAGLYNRLGTEMGGRVIENEDLVNVPNWLPLRFRHEGDGSWFATDPAVMEDYRQELDVRRGVLTRSFVWLGNDGRRTRVTQRRFVSMREPHLAGLETTFLAENWSGTLEVQSALDGTVVNAGVPRYRQLNSRHLVPLETEPIDDEGISLTVETSQSRVQVSLAARTRVIDNGSNTGAARQTEQAPGWIAQQLNIELAQDQAVSVEKMVTLVTSRDRAISAPGVHARKLLGYAESFPEALEAHVLAWDHLWRRFHLSTDANVETQRILNVHIFHVLQTASKHSIDLDVGVPARGWHGEAYRGHIFWDEVFILPFLNLHLPDLTRSLLQYRYRRLSSARRAATAAGFEGAMYPWQSGSSGREETQTMHLNPNSGNWLPDNSHLQRHINIAVAYNVWQYFQATEDVDFLAFYGAEMLVEISRFWSSIASYNKALDRFEIRHVMGPDEYHDGYPDADEPGLHNNAYTNIMVAWLLQKTLQALEQVPEFRRRELAEKLGLRREEEERWEELCRKLVVPFHGDRIISQFEGYENLEEFDWAGYTERYGDIHRLDRILEAEDDTPNRYQASKQADVLMLFFLLSKNEAADVLRQLGYEWDDDLVARNVAYYMGRTSHGSTLSRLVHSWVLARSDQDKSWEFFMDALYSDVADIQGGTTAEGIHLGAMAGTVDLVQRCFAGVQTSDGVLRFDPAVPKELGRLSFDVQYRGIWIGCEVTENHVVLDVSSGLASPITVAVRDEEFVLEPGSRREVSLR